MNKITAKQYEDFFKKLGYDTSVKVTEHGYPVRIIVNNISEDKQMELAEALLSEYIDKRKTFLTRSDVMELLSKKALHDEYYILFTDLYSEFFDEDTSGKDPSYSPLITLAANMLMTSLQELTQDKSQYDILFSHINHVLGDKIKKHTS